MLKGNMGKRNGNSIPLETGSQERALGTNTVTVYGQLCSTPAHETQITQQKHLEHQKRFSRIIIAFFKKSNQVEDIMSLPGLPSFPWPPSLEDNT